MQQWSEPSEPLANAAAISAACSADSGRWVSGTQAAGKLSDASVSKPFSVGSPSAISAGPEDLENNPWGIASRRGPFGAAAIPKMIAPSAKMRSEAARSRTNWYGCAVRVVAAGIVGGGVVGGILGPPVERVARRAIDNRRRSGRFLDSIRMRRGDTRGPDRCLSSKSKAPQNSFRR